MPSKKKTAIQSLKKKDDFLDLKNNGHRLFSYFLLFSYRENSEKCFRLGITVPKKVGKATIRNKLKRWTKEAVKKSEFLKSSYLDLNVVFRPQKQKEFYKKLKYEEFEKKFFYLEKKIQ